MATKKQSPTTNAELADLLRKILAIQLFQLGVPQARIAKKVRLSINIVNGLLKGVKRNA